MYRRTALILAGMTLLGLAVPQSAFAQSEPFAGLWQVNLAKSKRGAGTKEPDRIPSAGRTEYQNDPCIY